MSEEGFSETSVKIPCCMCGIMITPNPSNMCMDCIRAKMDLSGKIPEKSEVVYCRDCGRYQVDQTHWINAELESQELLQLCLKKLPSTIKIIDAKFLFTEPHSKRLRVQVTYVREDFHGTMLRQSSIVTYIVKTVQCKTCQELATPNRDHWKAIVQLRQHSESKRTMFWIEQQLITHGAAASATAVERKPDGLDFQFKDKSSAEKLISFIKGIIPIEVKQSNTVKGQDLVNMQYDTRFTYSLKCPAVSREDLVLLPKKIFDSTGRQSPLCIVTKIGRGIKFTNPFTGHTFVVDGKTFLSLPFEPLISHERLVKFAILSKDIVGKNGEYTIADFELTDVDTYEERVIVRSYLGGLLNEGDLCTAYDLRCESFTDESERALKKLKFERVIITGKSHEPREGAKKKKYHVKTLAPTMKEDEKAIDDFLDEIEDNPEIAEGITLVED